MTFEETTATGEERDAIENISDFKTYEQLEMPGSIKAFSKIKIQIKPKSEEFAQKVFNKGGYLLTLPCWFGFHDRSRMYAKHWLTIAIQCETLDNGTHFSTNSNR